MPKSKEELEQEEGEAREKKEAGRAGKAGSGKLVLFNHSRNPYNLGKNADGTERIFKIGEQIECADQAEYDMLRNYKGVSTTVQVAPSLDARIRQLENEKSELEKELSDARQRLEKFEHKGK